MKKLVFVTLLTGIVLCTTLAVCSDKQQRKPDDQVSDNNLQLTNERLRRMDSLDYEFYNNQMWDSFAISHDANIKAYYPDGTTTTGLYPQHIDMLKPMFEFAPDTKAVAHPVKFGTGEWTTVIGEVEGTFSKPMPIGNGKTIQPTGKKFKFTMCTVGRWKDGKMIEEYLFWDNQSIMKQIGLAQQGHN